MLRSRCLVPLAVSMFLSSCDDAPPESPTVAPAPAATIASGAPIDLADVMRRVHFAFRPDGDAFSGGHTTYTVRAGTSGIAFTPFRFDRRPIEGAPLVLGATEIRRDVALYARPTAHVDREGRVHVDRGLAVETISNHDEGVAQEWTFAAPPDGAGDVTVRIPVLEGRQLYAGATEHGLHFIDLATAVGVRYGLATWIDATGRRTPLVPTYEPGAIAIRIPASLVNESSYPAVLDPVIGPEFGLDSPIGGGPAGFHQLVPAVSSLSGMMGPAWLVVWEDYRGFGANVVATRVSEMGGPGLWVQDPSGIQITTGIVGRRAPAVACSTGMSAQCLVVWEDDRSGTTAIFGRLVSSSGTLGSEIQISSGSGVRERPDVSTTGTDFYVVWQDRRGGVTYDVRGTRVSSTGVVLDATGTSIAAAAGNQTRPAIAFGGGTYYVVWQDERGITSDVYGVRVSTGGVVTAPEAAISTAANNQTNPDVTYDGNFLAVWEDNRAFDTTGIDIQAQRVTSGGALSGGNFAITTAAGAQDEPRVAFASSASVNLVIWRDARGGGAADLYGRRVGTGSPSTAEFVIAATADEEGPGDVWFGSGSNFLVAWQTLPTGTGADIVASRLPTSETGPLDLPPVRLSSSDNTQWGARTAFDGTNFLIVWADHRAGSSGFDVYGVRVNQLGSVLDFSGIPIATGPGDQSTPTVTFHSTNNQYVVAWTDTSAILGDIYAVNVTTGGLVGVAYPIATSPNDEHQPAASYNAARNEVLFVYTDDNLVSGSNIVGVIVSAMADAPFTIAGAAGNQLEARVAPLGNVWLVVWTDERGAPDQDVYGVRVGGSPAGPLGTEIAFSTGVTLAQRPDVAADGGDLFLVVWDQATTTPADVVGKRYRLSTTSIIDASPLTIGDGGGAQIAPVVSWDGYYFAVTWNDAATSTYDIAGTWMRASDGARMIAPTVIAGDTANDEVLPGVASTTTGKTLLAYNRWTPASAAQRVYARFISFAKVLGDSCGAGSECLSGNCVDGVCCNVAACGTTSDCMLCNAGSSLGAGTCGAANPGAICRAASGLCDQPESCDGITNACPADAFLPLGSVCRDAAGDCDVEEVCTGTSASCPADTFSSAGEVCRGAFDSCDVAEACDGLSPNCPPDAWASSGTVCRAAAGACDAAETCDGFSPVCPFDSYLPSTTVCRASAGTCDVAENCTGTSPACPANAFQPSTTVCRAAAAGGCDVAENCTGTSASCPTDAFQPSTTVCRAAVGPCDSAENCTGTSASCPSDALAPSGTVCRAAAGACDLAETCSGTSSACPSDALAPATTVCRAAAAGGCDVAENCTGTSVTCPTDSFTPSTAVCRTAAGTCDLAENCTGTSASCPTDLFAPSSTVCRAAAAGGCDVAENCTGTSASCPADAFAAATTVCRAAAGACDVSENCTGASASCPTDAFAPATLVCRGAVTVCDVPENCTGTGVACPADAFEPSTTACRASAGPCDPAEFCTGTGTACPSNAFEPAATICRAAVGGGCDIAENCTGTGPSCPTDVVAPSATTCRPAAGTCDTPENCTGSSNTCPTDLFLASTTVCRAAVPGGCDLAENCTGTGPSCPADQVAPSTAVCRPSAGICDAAENCTGTTATCPADAFEPSTTVCRAAVAGGCDLAESCTGDSATCPPDAIAPAMTVCRAATSVCDLAESCTGASTACPADGFAASTVECRASAHGCDAAESCTGTSAVCPTDLPAADGTSCEDGDPCSADDVCDSGSCVAGVDTITFSPTSLSFSPTFVGSSAGAQTVTMHNNGATIVTVTSVTSTGDFPVVVAPPVPPFGLPADGDHAMDVDFAPTGIGVISDAVEVATASCTFLFAVDGTGLLADLTIDPDDGNFGDVDIMGTGIDRTFTITNSGSSMITIDDVSIRDGVAFSIVTPGPSLPITLAPSENVMVTVRARPLVEGPVEDELQIAYTPGAGSPIVVGLQLAANGICPGCGAPDAGVPDAAPDDASPVDGGPDAAIDVPDGAPVDAPGSRSDAGAPRNLYGCDCAVGRRASRPGAGAWIALAALALATWVSGRSRRRR